MKDFLARIGYRLGWLLANNNGRCYALWVITGVLLVVAVFSGFGEPILTDTIEKKISEISQSKYHQSVYDAWYGPEKAKARARGEEWPPERKRPSLLWSWKWWIIFLLFFFISLIYTPIAFREEVREAWEEAWRKIKEKEEAEAKIQSAKTESPEAKSEGSRKIVEDWQVSFARLFFIDLLAEFVWGVLQRIFAGMIRRR